MHALIIGVTSPAVSTEESCDYFYSVKATQSQYHLAGFNVDRILRSGGKNSEDEHWQWVMDAEFLSFQDAMTGLRLLAGSETFQRILPRILPPLLCDSQHESDGGFMAASDAGKRLYLFLQRCAGCYPEDLLHFWLSFERDSDYFQTRIHQCYRRLRLNDNISGQMGNHYDLIALYTYPEHKIAASQFERISALATQRDKSVDWTGSVALYTEPFDE